MEESVVEILEREPSIVQITMQDKTYKNGFSSALMLGLVQAFKTIRNNENYKVIILTGYDNYFATGGTREGLLSIADNEVKFSDTNLYSLILDCPIPVISAMQGHGIGGGFVMGLFADFVILSRESVFTTNFMKYGFTPGMGATYIIPKKLGLSLGHELLFNAQTYRGEELKQRGVPFPVFPRNEVLIQAYKTARQLAEKPRNSLVTLKEHLVADLRKELPEIIEREEIMHTKTFHSQEIKDRINVLY